MEPKSTLYCIETEVNLSKYCGHHISYCLILQSGGKQSFKKVISQLCTLRTWIFIYSTKGTCMCTSHWKDSLDSDILKFVVVASYNNSITSPYTLFHHRI